VRKSRVGETARLFCVCTPPAGGFSMSIYSLELLSILLIVTGLFFTLPLVLRRYLP
jgi:hypothetical protein